DSLRARGDPAQLRAAEGVAEGDGPPGGDADAARGRQGSAVELQHAAADRGESAVGDVVAGQDLRAGARLGQGQGEVAAAGGVGQGAREDPAAAGDAEGHGGVVAQAAGQGAAAVQGVKEEVGLNPKEGLAPVDGQVGQVGGPDVLAAAATKQDAVLD